MLDVVRLSSSERSLHIGIYRSEDQARPWFDHHIEVSPHLAPQT
jgi:hypothetical protein